MYKSLSNLIIAFHGCSIETFEDVLHNHNNLDPSKNTYDWLGNGMYFWENSYDRAVEWAKTHSKSKPAVIGAVIDLGYCLNLTDYGSIDILRLGHNLVNLECESMNIPLPINKDVKNNKDKLIRDLDCAVIERIHRYHEERKLKKYDSVRGVFIEGSEVYENSGFREKTHIQICVVNPNCIRGFFAPRVYNDKYERV